MMREADLRSDEVFFAQRLLEPVPLFAFFECWDVEELRCDGDGRDDVMRKHRSHVRVHVRARRDGVQMYTTGVG
eukprot:3940770-Rhodomonas_salina.2